MDSEQTRLIQEAERAFDLMEKYEVMPPEEIHDVPKAMASFAQLAALFLDAMDEDWSVNGLLTGMSNLNTRLQTEIDSLPANIRFSNFPDLGKLACEKGCSYCCSVRATVVGPEVLLIARELRQHLSEKDLTDLLDRISAFETTTSQMTEEEKISRTLLCPLNLESLCTAYQVRPLSCIGYHSFSLDQCVNNYRYPNLNNLIVQDKERQHFFTFISGALFASLDALALDRSELELATALKIALTDPDAGEKYLNGEPVFADAHEPATVEAFENAMARRSLDHG